jgi:hypothetical protein
VFFKKSHIDHDFTSILESDHTQTSSTCIKHQVYEISDIHQKFGGFPESFCLENTRISQLWWTADQIDFETLGRKLGMEPITVSSILQTPGNTIPYHRDTFFQIKQRFPDRTDIKVRANVFLEDWRLGHMIQYTLDDCHYTVTDWKAGDFLMWDESVLHLSCNAGMQNKYTLQVSGFLTAQAS